MGQEYTWPLAEDSNSQAVDPDKTPPGGTEPSELELGTPAQREAATIDDLVAEVRRIADRQDATISDLRAERIDRARDTRLLIDGQHAILGEVAALRGRVASGDEMHGEALAWRAKAERLATELDERVRRLETQRPSGLSGAIAAVSARASQSEEAIVAQLREANDALRDERDARIAEDKRRLDAELEAARTRRAWVTRAVVFLCGAGGLALIGLVGRACGG